MSHVRRDFSGLRSLSAEPGRPTEFTRRSARNSSAGGITSFQEVIGAARCPASSFWSVCVSIIACASDVAERSASVLGRFFAVPPPFRRCALLNSETPSGVVSVVKPLLSGFAARPSSTYRAENASHSPARFNRDSMSSSSAVCVTSKPRPFSVCVKSLV